MGGQPLAVFLSLALPKQTPQAWVERFFRGLLSLARKCDVSLAGGDTAESPAGILADIVVLGSAPRGRSVLRSGARPGDAIYVSGRLGGSAATLRKLRAKTDLRPKDFPQHFFPQPRLEVGRFLREKGVASAMIDTSDGLSTDLAHVCQESHVGAEIEAECLPRASIGRPLKEVDLQFALHGGEDYELLFTVQPGKRIPKSIAGIKLTRIGRIIRGRGLTLVNVDGSRSRLRPQGWEHFRT